ncbi:DNA repair protein RecN [Marinicellulosiphila megalodicopiae]|uniref:DNA repair protein RecN n=1 Tax=Marinicellulosiphila megalodicopiae TaxID=2724896 RepID=UPI003BB196FE
MLTQLSIRNFVLAKEIFLDIQSGMTAITGETGAGKSILLNALNLTLGGRAEQGIVRNGEARADVSASFDIRNQTIAHNWLVEHDLDEQFDCILRRTIAKDGRSKAFVNGQPVTLVQLKEIGSMLIDIHSQHQHQSLLKASNHRRLLDDYAGNDSLAASVKDTFYKWKKANNELNELLQNSDEYHAMRQLLNYQIDEMCELELSPEHIEKLETIQKSQSQIQNTMLHLESAQNILNDESFNPAAGIAQCERQILPLLKMYPELQDTLELLQSAQIQIDESLNNIEHFSQNLETDPQVLLETEQQLSTIYDLARKHGVSADALESHYSLLCEQLAQLDSSDVQITQLKPKVLKLHEQYLKLCKKLNKSRMVAIPKFNEAICEQLSWLNMSGAQFRCKTIKLSAEQYNEFGTEQIEFEVAINAGQDFKALQKSASGGELSRISLAIAVICAQRSCVPTMIFDEIDIGISGATAQMVGKQLSALGKHAQLLCVTHLSQVASQASQHWLVEKAEVANQTISSIRSLDKKQRTHEIARMIGGIDITDRTLAHANEILKSSSASLQ